MTIGPSMANLVQYYGHRRAYGLSVSPNPLNRNPSYEPLVNPDQALRDNEIQYVVWDAFSASRSPKFSSRLLRYAARYDGRAVHSEVLPATGARRPDGPPARDRRLRGAPVIARVAVAVVLAGSFAGPAVAAPATPIEHFVVLMQENHSFDNYFGTFPGRDGIPRDTCMPVGALAGRAFGRFTSAAARVPSPLTTLASTSSTPGAGWTASSGRRRSTGSPSSARSWATTTGATCRSTGTSQTSTSSSTASSPRRRMAASPTTGLWVSGIFGRLQERGIPWKFYVQDYDPRLGPGSAQAVRVPLRDPRLSRHIVDLDEYYSDLERGRLPAVAYIAPAGASEHPPGRIAAGATLTRALLTALARSSAWNSSAFLWTYDESGGWFDHVRPPPGAGFRVPALLVSPYARRGFVDSTPLDTTSIPAFVERNWGLGAGALGHAASTERVRLLARAPARRASSRRAAKAGGAPGARASG